MPLPSLSPKSHHMSPVIKSLHWLKVKEQIKYKFISLTTHSSFPNPLTSAPLSLYSHLAQPACPPSSDFSVHPTVLASNWSFFQVLCPFSLEQSPPSPPSPSMRLPSPKPSLTHAQLNSIIPHPPLALSNTLFHSVLKILLFNCYHHTLSPLNSQSLTTRPTI
jgi:hypothetical protein